MEAAILNQSSPMTRQTPQAREKIEAECNRAVTDICALNWAGLSADDLIDVAWIYYFFSVQFCENVGIARALYPHDEHLLELDHGERNTDNLSPCPNVVEEGEKVDHDEFMRRALRLQPMEASRRRRLQAIGADYLDKIRSMDAMTRTTSLPSYEAGGLQAVFEAMMKAPHWDGPLLQAFRHFVVGHIALDSAEDGHGTLCKHLEISEGVVELWRAYKDALIEGVPNLVRH